jgi:hypothetical protein
MTSLLALPTSEYPRVTDYRLQRRNKTNPVQTASFRSDTTGDFITILAAQQGK